MSNNYGDYVIKDGKFVGEFDEMYQNCDNPWHQLDNNVLGSAARTVIIDIVRRFGGTVHEFGCGLGAFSNRIAAETGLSVTGIDISQTAIDKASLRFKNDNLQFVSGNITNIDKFIDTTTIILSELLWYVLNDLDVCLDKLQKYFKGKNLIIQQTFYREGIQKYGREYFYDLDSLIKYLPFECIGKCIFDFNLQGQSYETVSVYRI